MEPVDIDDLKRVLVYLKANSISYFVMGGGTNLLVNDTGFRGAVIQLSSPYFGEISVDGNIVKVGAGLGLSKMVRFCCENGLAGIESLVGIPGTVGGAIFMNAGGASNPVYRNMGDVIEWLTVINPEGDLKRLARREIPFGYRSSGLDGCIIIESAFRLETEERSGLLSRCSNLLSMKRRKQILDCPSAGCVFKNPAGSQLTSGQMIGTLGLRGAAVGGAEVSTKHANFIINKNFATCEDVDKLIKLIRSKVKESYDVDLELEVRVI